MNKECIFFAKLREQAIIPSKREEDGAFDIYACFDEEYMRIEPLTTVMVPSGIASVFSDRYVAILKERGSTGTRGIGQRAGVIDSGYRGEWLIALSNINNKPLIIAKEGYRTEEDVIIYPYEKAICQCIMIEVPKLEIKEISMEELKGFVSERGAGRLGSSGK